MRSVISTSARRRPRLDLIAPGVLKTQELITHRFPLDRINEAFDAADDKPRTRAILVAIEV